MVIGAPVRRARGADAERAIAGFTVLNDVSCRDWQSRTREWLQDKNWEATAPLGPFVGSSILSGHYSFPAGIRRDRRVQCNRTRRR